MPYIGRAPSSGIRSRFIYTATASQTTFTGADGNGKTLGYTDGEYVDVYLNGVLLDPADYTATSKTSVVLDSGATVSDIVEIVVYDTFSVFNGTFTGDLTVDGDTLFVDASENAVGIGITSSLQKFTVANTSSGIVSRFTNNVNQTLDLGVVSGSGSAGGVYYDNANSGYHDFRVGNTSKMRLLADGTLLVGKTASDFDGGIFEAGSGGTFVSRSGSPMNVNRNDSDGKLIGFSRDGVEKGDISVSGSTVSLTGAHLTRWAQLSDGSKDTSILRGTVMTNLDQMAVWAHDAVAATYYVDGDELPEGVSVGDEKTPAKDAYTEDNEQLNCVAVSSVEGDPNVAGVLSSWDDDDDQFNDMKIGMTGDMVIRIAQGTTVSRGDLLMSAGDGTAKPQGDDIVRSKTIAKVISTNVSHTYDDGSYLVPCALMAC